MALIAAPGWPPLCARVAASPCQGNAPLIVLGLQGAEDLASACGAPDKLRTPHSRGSFPKLCALSMWIACGSKLMPAE